MNRAGGSGNWKASPLRMQPSRLVSFRFILGPSQAYSAQRPKLLFLWSPWLPLRPPAFVSAPPSVSPWLQCQSQQERGSTDESNQWGLGASHCVQGPFIPSGLPQQSWGCKLISLTRFWHHLHRNPVYRFLQQIVSLSGFLVCL